MTDFFDILFFKKKSKTPTGIFDFLFLTNYF